METNSGLSWPERNHATLSAAVLDFLELHYELELKAAKWYATADTANSFFSTSIARQQITLCFYLEGYLVHLNYLPGHQSLCHTSSGDLPQLFSGHRGTSPPHPTWLGWKALHTSTHPKLPHPTPSWWNLHLWTKDFLKFLKKNLTLKLCSPRGWWKKYFARCRFFSDINIDDLVSLIGTFLNCHIGDCYFKYS